jgi:arylformamidase
MTDRGPLATVLPLLIAVSVGGAAAAGSLPPGVRLLPNVPYGEEAQQRMDVYVPSRARRAPVLFMVHGGAWRFGDKTNGRVVTNKLARWAPRGFVFVSVDYRLLPGADPLRQADDVARALAAVQAQATRWGADPGKVILMGHSAGAHLVALLSAAPAKAYALGVKPWLGSVILDSAALDVEAIMQRRHLPLYDRAFGGDPGYWRSASAVRQLSSSAAPMLLVCSERRMDDSCGMARQFADKAASVGGRTSVLPQDLSHREINEDLGRPGAYTDAVEAFLRTLDKSVATALASR